VESSRMPPRFDSAMTSGELYREDQTLCSN
jgi:hypothetical protein